ncbi:MAG: PAS domain S-box protein [gamma proteobacterium symbiont of Bathyaustriella thionipta]|nr:PAS domain S-box protein [gamma proteobacterium symbiont of Bathyaustriella thionipta]MCU7948789.1 PAS domain S-box protein [gamma proteobacterium symbiont of Bathyaustriella thionipta]MCU7954201.1 PAS domain S-box protein [gamma proteobacterium symbiont of Bathyaustriella thionipta]MCU7955247.1 PAS domain S-box protein [gamma proteobacterium symbiont of Bathyaustriella thionipta]MCU7966256.1 PAS domain S-box protein [gamma proteobacterium symbiont of Bathyaustriella thionipta]
MDTLTRLTRRVEREQKARKEAEALLEKKSFELYQSNQELKSLAAELADKEERNRLLLESSSDGIYAIDREGLCSICNPAAAHMLGYESPEQVIGKNAHMLFHHSHQDGSKYPEEECVLQTGLEKEIKLNVLFWRVDGSPIDTECRAAPIKQNGEVVGSVVSFTDISERLETEMQLRQAQKLESIGQLAAGIAHEINTPTQFVNDNIHFLQEAFEDYHKLMSLYDQFLQASEETVQEDKKKEVNLLVEEIDLEYLQEEIPQAISQSIDGLKRIAKIVRAMKEFSHPGEHEKVLIDINNAIETTIDVSRNEWKYHAELETNFDSDLPQVPCLPGEFNQVILNLIVNASHAIADVVTNSGNMGKILISTQQDGDWVEITVSDTGGGVPEEIQGRIFDPFFTTKEVGKGTGQGLAITYSVVVDKHGGTIVLDSQQGVGTVFTVRLPIKVEQLEVQDNE